MVISGGLGRTRGMVWLTGRSPLVPLSIFDSCDGCCGREMRKPLPAQPSRAMGYGDSQDSLTPSSNSAPYSRGLDDALIDGTCLD